MKSHIKTAKAFTMLFGGHLARYGVAGGEFIKYTVWMLASYTPFKEWL
jgi:hypothetical protein